MHRFFIVKDGGNSSLFPLSREEAQHALKVLRLKDGEAIEALDGKGGIWEAVLRVHEGEVLAEIGSELESAEADVHVTVYMGIPKGEKLEFIAQKLTELGVKRLVPVRMERCIAKIEDKEQEKKLGRIRKISLEAQKQCGRAGILEITPPVSFKKAMDEVKDYDVALLLWEEADGYRIRDAYKDFPSAKNIACFVGPEGGISQKEAEGILSQGAKCVTLGPRILRAETAAVTGSAVIMSLWGDI